MLQIIQRERERGERDGNREEYGRRERESETVPVRIVRLGLTKFRMSELDKFTSV